jgi:hypothetical protein
VRPVSRGLQALRDLASRAVPAIALLAAGVSAVRAQQLIVSADASRVSVGQQVTVRIETRPGAGARPSERLPRLVDTLPEGVRLVSEDSLTSVGTGAYVARMRFAFFRPGTASVPALVLAFRTSESLPADTFHSQPLPIQVIATLPPGYQPMRDIKDLQSLSTPTRDSRWLIVLATFALGVALYLAGVRRRRVLAVPSDTSAASLAHAPAATSGPYGRALALLREIEEARWPSTGDVARHYERVTDVLRIYLENEHRVRATDRTTAEVVWSLPTALEADGQREECEALLEMADLVKFARVQPDEKAAAAFLGRVRALLARWHSVAPTTAGSETSIAVPA